MFCVFISTICWLTNPIFCILPALPFPYTFITTLSSSITWLSTHHPQVYQFYCPFPALNHHLCISSYLCHLKFHILIQLILVILFLLSRFPLACVCPVPLVPLSFPSYDPLVRACLHQSCPVCLHLILQL